MGIQLLGSGGTVIGADVDVAKALHVGSRPAPGNHFRVYRRLVPAVSTTAGNLWTFRNPTGSGLVMLVTYMRLRAVQNLAATAAIEDIFNAKIARAYTVADTTGSVSIAPAASMGKLRTSMGNAVAELRESNAAAGASGGTKTVDTDAITGGAIWQVAALATTPSLDPREVFIFQPNVADNESPAILAASEGILIANTNSLGTASGLALLFDIAWDEVSAY